MPFDYTKTQRLSPVRVGVITSVAKGGGGGGWPGGRGQLLFRSFIGAFGNLSAHACKPTCMSFVPTKYLNYAKML